LDTAADPPPLDDQPERLSSQSTPHPHALFGPVAYLGLPLHLYHSTPVANGGYPYERHFAAGPPWASQTSHEVKLRRA
jgi:hypothetical protein